MSDLPTTPQLHMLRPHLRELPEIVLPAGHTLRTFCRMTARTGRRIIGLSFQTEPEKMPFDSMMRASPAFRRSASSSSAAGRNRWRPRPRGITPEMTPDAGTVHFVGTLPGHTGKRLGYWCTVATLRHMVEEGLQRAWLSTDDFRLPAIKIYLDLGFVPLLVHDNQRERWPAFFAKLGLPQLTDTFADILHGPLWEQPAPLPVR